MQNTTISTQVTEATLEEAPARASAFLNGIAAIAEIRAILAQAGMQDSDILEGRSLLVAALECPAATNPAWDSEDAKAQRAAVVEIDSWDEPAYARAQAVLRRYYPSAADYVFADLSASRGVEAVRGALTFCLRLKALEEGTDPARASSRKQDKKAVEKLASRGFTKAERERIYALAQLALGPTQVVQKPGTPEAATKRRDNLSALRSWYEDWSATARAVIRKREYLIRLGMGKRRKGAIEPEEEAAAPAAGQPTPSQ